MNELTIGQHSFDLAMPVAVLLAVTVVLTVARTLYRQWRAEPAQRSRAWRVALLVLAQPLCAGLLYFALFPPTLPGEAGTLLVASAGATGEQFEALAAGDARVALPEAPELPGVERVPDLATALRRHPGTQRIRIAGAGLTSRDREAVQGMALEFVPAPLPRGLVELAAPVRAAAGGEFRVAGRAEHLRGGIAELLDPGLQRVDRAPLDGEGRFVLGATTRVPGVAIYRLRLRDARQRLVEDVELPLQIDADAAPRVLMLAGAPNPELKHLRRWALDAGLAMHTQIAAGGGMQLGDAPIALNAANLSRFDVAVLDERAWSALGDAQRAVLVEAVRDGLGLLLRVTATLPDSEQRRLRALGFQVDAGRDSAVVRLTAAQRDGDAERARIGPGTRDASRAVDAEVAEIPALTRRTLRLDGSDALPLWRDDADRPLGLWRALGRGRIGVWTLTDTYRLVLAGRGDRYGELWSGVIASLARAQRRSSFEVRGDARAGERVALCGVASGASVVSPDGTKTPLLPDPATGSPVCAAYWPRGAGWHRLQSVGRSQLFHVRAADSAPGLRAAVMREATQRLAAGSGAMPTTAPAQVPGQPGRRWPWWAAWLLASAGLWWLERSRAGRALQVG